MSFIDISSYIGRHLRTVGAKLVYVVLLLYYAYGRPDTPSWAKRIIIGAIAYFLSPLDAVPDLTPFIGFTDDLGVLSFGLVTIACYIDDHVRDQARTKVQDWMGDQDPRDYDEVDKLL